MLARRLRFSNDTENQLENLNLLIFFRLTVYGGCRLTLSLLTISLNTDFIYGDSSLCHTVFTDCVRCFFRISKRAKYSRRRPFDEDADIDYINERNMKFNKKLERFYGKYTAEIKQNLERGTAI